MIEKKTRHTIWKEDLVIHKNKQWIESNFLMLLFLYRLLHLLLHTA